MATLHTMWQPCSGHMAQGSCSSMLAISCLLLGVCRESCVQTWYCPVQYLVDCSVVKLNCVVLQRVKKEGNLIRYIKIRHVSTIRLKSLLHCGVHVVRHSEEEKGSVISYASIHSSYYFSSSVVSLNSVYLFGCRVTVTDLHICTDHLTVQCMILS